MDRSSTVDPPAHFPSFLQSRASCASSIIPFAPAPSYYPANDHAAYRTVQYSGAVDRSRPRFIVCCLGTRSKPSSAHYKFYGSKLASKVKPKPRKRESDRIHKQQTHINQAHLIEIRRIKCCAIKDIESSIVGLLSLLRHNSYIFSDFAIAA
ncbi:hypothetical protein EYC84_011200 [Monilinia fructicola]|uniref:Uncharacterized protein n=1 Tax=Monilinia fructicola TaxID=38448 RepID=A0A5M9JAA2_MONFR|nr:hypothetical protein EYC84_011200 [Monilinia fructicola]